MGRKLLTKASSSALEGSSPEQIAWLTDSMLSIVVVGASGDLAKKKTYPSLLNLFRDDLLPDDTVIWGYARSKLTDEDLRSRIRPYLIKSGDHPEEVVDEFLQRCRYQGGSSYGDVSAFETLKTSMEEHESSLPGLEGYNRLFYFAIPPNVFAETGLAIKKTCMQDTALGWTRLIVEKPFGRDLQSFEELNETLSQHFTEKHLYRIDHYLGKEMVQNLTVLRFSNTWMERTWNSDTVKTVMLTFKEPFGTEGRGGYFDQYGIIRDILQNHLLQVLTLVTMEAPVTVEGPGSGKAIRDSKVAILNAIPPIELEDAVLGQYEGYADDPTIENKDTNTPTFAVIRLKINTPRWHGVPIILKAGKALNERKAEIRVQFKDAPAAGYLFEGQECPRNELVIRMQPNESVYLKTNVKSPGFAAKPVQSELEVNYENRFFSHGGRSANPDAYTRLILDVLQGKQGAFVRDDELRRAWEIFTPLLHRIERENVRPLKYPQGSRGPLEADEFIFEKGKYERNEDYVFPGADGTLHKVSFNTVRNAPEYNFSEDEKCEVGLWGLAVTGQNFALNLASKGFKVVVGNRTKERMARTLERAKEEGDLPMVGSSGVEEFVARLSKPRKVFIFVQAGKPVDATITKLSAFMQPGDVIVDCGNEWFPNSTRRADALKPRGISFLGVGISGGEEGARNGPAIMAGGTKAAYDLVSPIFTKCAAQLDSGPCIAHLGPVETGHYVKIVQNGVLYGDLQLIAEVYDLLKHVLKMDNEEIANLFAEWSKGELDSYLIEITEKIVRKKEGDGEGYIIDNILDKAGMKGTGRWAVQEAAERDIAAPTFSAALETRMLSSRREERLAASKVLNAPTIESVDRDQVIGDLRAALYASKICSYAQGFNVIKAASEENGWNIDLSEVARLWMGGVIRAQLLSRVTKAYSENANPSSLLVDPVFAAEINERSSAWRRVVALCVTSGIPCPSLCGSLTYFDTYRRERLPINLTQAHRDFFGGHSYERVDKEGRYHTAWTEAHKDIGDANKRNAGESIQI